MTRVIHKLAARLDDVAPKGAYLDTVKSRLNPTAAGVVGVEQELLREAAASLGRQGERLERALSVLAQIECDFARAPTQTLVLEHRTEREAAERALANLKIQREALGIRNHRELERRYLLPPPLRMPR